MSDERTAFEHEYPGASWLATRALREIESVGMMLERLVAGVARRHGLSHGALNALAVIEGNAGPLAAGDVASRMHITSGTVTSILDTLERLDYVRRLPDPGDRRRVLIDVTRAGQAVLDALLPEVQQLGAVALSPLGDGQLQAILDAMSQVRSVVAAMPAITDPPAARRTPPHLRRS